LFCCITGFANANYLFADRGSDRLPDMVLEGRDVDVVAASPLLCMLDVTIFRARFVSRADELKLLSRRNDEIHDIAARFPALTVKQLIF